ncbi:MAG TPA: SMC-Scp complex subunit ScpB, partial [Nitrospirota bacterium]|nr:SMC-Scp complex subunit ScpB [Nitrospirota bacterium]
MEDQQLKSAIEAILFVAGNPLSAERLTGLFEEEDAGRIEAQLASLAQEYDSRGSGIMLAEVAG